MELTEQFVSLDMAHAYAQPNPVNAPLPLAAVMERYPFSEPTIGRAYIRQEPAIAKALQRYLVFHHLRSGHLLHPVLALEVLKDKTAWLDLFPQLTRLMRRHAHWLSSQREDWKWWLELVEFDDSKGVFNPIYFRAKRMIQPAAALQWLLAHWESADSSTRQQAFDLVSLNPGLEEQSFFALAEQAFRGKRKLKAEIITRFITGDLPGMAEMKAKIEAEVNPNEWINFFLINTLKLPNRNLADELISYLFPKGAIYDLGDTADFLDMQHFNGQLILNGSVVKELKEKPWQRMLVNVFRHNSFLTGADLGENLLDILGKETVLMSDNNLLHLAATLPVSALSEVEELARARDILAGGRYRSPLVQKIKKVIAFRRINE